MPVSSSFVLWACALVVVIAAPATPAGARAVLLASAGALTLPALVALVAADPITLGALAFAGMALALVAVDFVFGQRPARLSSRLAFVAGLLFFIDARQARRGPRRLDRRAIVQLVGAALAAVAAWWVWDATLLIAPPARYLLRSVCGAIVVLAIAELMTAVSCLACAACGLEVRPPHDAPFQSLTVSEFWSRRWNPLVGRWLRRHCFAPVARRSPQLALWATFALSAAMHAYLLLAIDGWAALSWGAFFLAQPPLMLAERRLRVRHWPAPLARAWTVTTLVLLLPLLLSPVLPLIDSAL